MTLFVHSAIREYFYNMRYIFVFAFLLTCFMGFSQKATYVVSNHSDRITLDITIPMEKVEWIQTQEKYCPEGIAKVFCVNNYFQDKISLKKGKKNIELQIETSVSNTDELQINLKSVEKYTSLQNIDLEVNAFIDVFETWENHVKIKQDDTIHEVLTKETPRLEID